MLTEEERFARAEEITGHKFRERTLLENALTHSSVGGYGASPNERLETLGDAVVTLIITETLFLLKPAADQGEITMAKSALVSTRTLATISKECGLVGVARLGRGVERSVPRRISANLFEAIVGAVYLDGGLEAARDVILRLFGKHINDPSYGEPDPKSRLQQVSHERFTGQPVYEIVSTFGPPHKKMFRVRVVLDGTPYPVSEAGSKKAAERRAAKHALDVILGTVTGETPGEKEEDPADSEDRPRQ